MSATTSPSPNDSISSESRPNPQRRRKKLLFGAASLLCLGVGLASLRYVLPSIPAPAPLPNVVVNRNPLIIHAAFAAVALILVPVQLWTGRQRNGGKLHRVVGPVAVLAIYTAASSAYWLVPKVRGGPIAGLGFAALATAWIITLTKGMLAIHDRAYAAHRDWMIRTASLTVAAVTLRILMMISIATGIDYDEAYRVVAWLCWIPNLVLAEAWLTQEKRRQLISTRS